MATPTQIRRRGRFGLILGTLVAALMVAAVAYSSGTAVSVADVDAPTGSVTLAPGGSGNINIQVTVTGAQEGNATFKVNRDWSLSGGVWTGSNPQTFNVPGPRTGSTAALVLNTTGSVSVAAGHADGTFPLSVQVFDITNSNATGAKLSAGSAGSYSVTVETPAPSDTEAPQSVSISINSGAAWTNDASGNVSLSLSATDNVGITSYKLATSEAGLASATANTVSPAEATFSRSVSSFALGGSEDAAKEVWLQVCDAIGNCSSDKDTIGWDKTKPTITDLGPTTSPNGAGWYKTDVVNRFQAADSLSGLNAACQLAFPDDSGSRIQSKTTSSEGTAVKVSSDGCADVAGNSADAVESASFMIDKTPPTVSVTGVSNGASYTLGSVPTAGCSTGDSLSGVKTSASLSSSGGPVGSVTATCSGAVDNADNAQAAPVSVTYSVIYNWDGFFRPVDNPNTLNVVKAGSAVPLKFSIGGDQGLDILALAASKDVACDPTAPVDAVEEIATAGQSSLQYDASTGQYTYVWKSDKAWAGKCRSLQVKLNDNTSHYALFKFTK